MSAEGILTKIRGKGRTESRLVSALQQVEELLGAPGVVPGLASQSRKKIDVRSIRDRMGFSQQEFAARFGISISTLRNWEQGSREPEGPARAYLTVIMNDPVAVLRALEQERGLATANPKVGPALGDVSQEDDRSEKPVLGSWTALLEYLQVALAHEPIEQFRLLFLDRKNILIRDEVQQRGTVDHTPCYPREIVKRALELGASAIIMVHNHPSGDPTPSRADIDMTKQVVQALAAVGITVHDHVIVGRNRHTSFRTQKLL